MQTKQKKLLRDIIQWDVKSWSKALFYWEENINWNQVENCLELGAREGGLSLWLSQMGKNVVCSDLANTKSVSEKLHKRYNTGQNIKYMDIDATNIPFENYFDIIVFKSILGGIDRNGNNTQQRLINEAHKALKPGGKLLFAENSIGSPLHQYFRKKFTPWQNYWQYISISGIKAMLLSFSSCEIKSTGFIGAFGRNETQRKYLAVADDLFFNRICADSWKYVIYGVAEK